MAKYKYSGPDGVNLGRFGVLKKGDVIDLSPKEEAYILANGHDHLKADDGKPAKPVTVPKPGEKHDLSKYTLPEGFDKLPQAEQDAILDKMDKEEAARLEGLAKSNAMTADMELDEMKKDELEDLIAKLRHEGVVVDCAKNANKQVMLNAIRTARGQPLKKEGDEAGGEE